jgi:catechol 2,3-dioxygenase
MPAITIKELGHVVLYVSNLERSRHFYKDLLGFREIAAPQGTALFSSGRTHHEMLLIEIGGPTKAHKILEPGLYHIGFKIGNTDEELSEALRVLEEHHVTIIGTADHTVTHSLYILDPDGNELELYVDVSDEWKTNPQAILTPTKPLSLS